MSTTLDASAILDLMPLARTLGVEFTAAGPDEVVGRLGWSAGLCTAGGVLHGGTLMALADSVGGVCAYLNLPPGAGTSTIESKTNFFRGLKSGTAVATGTPLHVGGRTIVVQTDIRDANGRRIALVTQTQAVLPGPTG